jgi:hypothetical protein
MAINKTHKKGKKDLGPKVAWLDPTTRAGRPYAACPGVPSGFTEEPLCFS